MALFNDITLGQYYFTDSLVHRLDPRSKFFACIIGMTCMLVTTNPAVLLATGAMLPAFIIAARLPFSLVLRNIKPFIILIVLTFMLNVFWAEGRFLLRIPWIDVPVYSEGIKLGIVFSLRLIILILFAAILTLTTSPIDLTDALDKLTAPGRKLGLPTHELTMMITLALRFIPTLLNEAERIKKAQLSRGATFDGNLIQRAKSVIPLIIPLFVSAFRRADELALAMDARCYTGGDGRTSFKELKFKRNDFLVLAGSLFFGAALFLWELVI
ncbi:energy-coupling factor transporter transmembrane protein EcfT [candidate division KSB1 bacterium]|nr:energy-coupling factor transporter transmembrane protein EcfT [candidate division KSB1 bacterium]